MDTNRLLGVLLGDVLRPPRRRTRRRGPAPLVDVRIGGSRRAASALATLATLAVEALAGSGAPPRPSAPPPRSAPMPTAGAGRASPWGSPPPPAPPPAAPSRPVGAEDREALLIVRAMIAAARADGALDAEERAAIAGQLDRAGLEAEARELVLAEFANPAPLEALAAEIGDPVLAAQVYAACVLAVGEPSPGERAWLDALARRTGLGAATVAAIEGRLAAEAGRG
jgi:uncharacterized membrane protein YebE (DUF533 family)